MPVNGFLKVGILYFLFILNNLYVYPTLVELSCLFRLEFNYVPTNKNNALLILLYNI